MLLRTKILTAFLLLLSALPVACTVAYLVKLEMNAFAMEEKLEQSSLQTIIVSSNELVWLEKDREVLIKGKLFDVKSTSIINDSTRLTGLFDTDENKILKDLYAMEENDEESSPVCSILAHMFCPAVLQKRIQAATAENTILKNTGFPYLQAVIYNNPCIGIITPPPNTAIDI